MAMEAELGRRNVPFVKYGGLRFLETAHVRDLMSFLRLAENPWIPSPVFESLCCCRHRSCESRDAAGFTARRRWPLLTRGHPQRYLPTALQTTGRSSFDCCRTWNSGQNRTQELPRTFMRPDYFYAPLLETKYDNVKARLNDLIQLEAIAAQYTKRQISLAVAGSAQFYAGTSADQFVSDKDYLILSTIHSAKGLEWDSVFVIHAADGNIPSDMATGSPEEIEEERRLFSSRCCRKNHLSVVPADIYCTTAARVTCIRSAKLRDFSQHTSRHCLIGSHRE